MAMFAGSCKQQNDNHLPPGKMPQVLFDIHLAETYSVIVKKDSSNRNTDRNLDSLALFYRSVFRHHNISRQEFVQSLSWYKRHPQELDSIYSRLIPEMSKLEDIYSN